MTSTETGTGWGWILAGGILSMAFGVAVLVEPSFGVWVMAIVLGLLLLFGGIAAIATAGEVHHKVFAVVLGVLAIAAGFIALVRPTAAVTVLAILFGISLLIRGTFRSFASIALEPAWWGLYLVLGLIAIGLGIVFISNPDFGVTVLVLLLGLEAILVGMSEIVLAFAVRRGDADGGGMDLAA